MSWRRLVFGWCSVVAVVALASACASASADAALERAAGGGNCATASCLVGSSDAGFVSIQADLDRPLTEDGVTAVPDGSLRALCGGGCGEDEEGAPVFPEDEGACVGAEAGGAGGQGGQGGAPGAPGCSIVEDDDGSPVGACSARGSGAAGDPCMMQADCAPGFACVGVDGAGQCRRYCCADTESCSKNTFCAARPLLDRHADPLVAPLQVPVCVEAHACRLDEPYPCPADQTCTCAEGTACTVVRSDGTTGCVPAPSPGGLEGEPCPCSPATLTGPGLICSQSTQTCLALCILGVDGASCGEGRRCQSSASLPDGFGICTSTLTTETQR